MSQNIIVKLILTNKAKYTRDFHSNLTFISNKKYHES